MSTNEWRREVEGGLFAGGRGVALLGVEVRAEVVGGHCRSAVRQRYRNDEARAVEAVYTFPLPAGGVVTGFAMTAEGRRIEGEVHERDEAFRRYDDALTAGHGAALLEQERPDVFTANVGNLLPGEETIIEIELLEPMKVEEGGVRYALPTLVAPRYLARVADADRLSPPTGNVAYGLSLEVIFDLGVELEVDSPSHDVRIDHGHGRRVDGRVRVSFAQREVALDRDVVVTAVPRRRAAEGTPIASVVAHRAGPIGAFALTIVPDLANGRGRREIRPDVVFVLDRSGSMGGASIIEARAALRLCLRQLREGDRFAILAFDDHIEELSRGLTTFTRGSLAMADRWIEGVEARGGTELLAPLVLATDLAPDGLIVLLTDGQVGNEDEVASAVLARRSSARVCSFGIGTSVSDALLRTLADRSGGTTEMIHPGERIDEKVVAQFARATAPRLRNLRITFRGVEIGELAPAAPLTLVDGEPFTLFGTYEDGGTGVVEVRGTQGGEPMVLEIPMTLPEREERPVVEKLWAQARIRDLERSELVGRRGQAMKHRIVQLAKDHGVSSKYTSFVVVDKRTGARRSSVPAETRVVPVSPPAGWSMGSAGPASPARSRGYGEPASGAPPPARSMARSVPGAARPIMRPMASSMPLPAQVMRSAPPPPSRDPVLATLERQSASGLWEEEGEETVLASVRALLALVRLGLSTSHPVHGAQTRKGVEALLERLGQDGTVEAAVAELALATLWLLATGRRTRTAIEQEASRRGHERLLELVAHAGDVRGHVERLATMC